jgi:hypothetical protein
VVFSVGLRIFIEDRGSMETKPSTQANQKISRIGLRTDITNECTDIDARGVRNNACCKSHNGKGVDYE